MTIYHQVLIDSKQEDVFKAITRQEGLSKWWIQDCIAKPEIGFVNVFKYEGYVDNEMKVIDLIENKRVEWECIKSEKEWIGTHIVFEISTHHNLTKLDFKQIGWKEQTEFFATCNFHWARHLTMLKKLCESGVNQVFQEKEAIEIKKVKG